MLELNRLGVTSCIDAGGGFQNCPNDYQVIAELHKRGAMTVRVAYNLFTQRPQQELDDVATWLTLTKPAAGSDFSRMNGAGEMLEFSAADFADFLEPRPDLPRAMEGQLNQVVTLLVKHRWPFRLHATYDESISRFRDGFEAVNHDVPFGGLRWFFDHANGPTASHASG
jgi:predicted amidohydrolase YtcJ